MSCQLKTVDMSEDVTVGVTADDVGPVVHGCVDLGLCSSGATNSGLGRGFDENAGVLSDVFGFGVETGGDVGVVLGSASCYQQKDKMCIYEEFSRQHSKLYTFISF